MVFGAAKVLQPFKRTLLKQCCWRTLDMGRLWRWGPTLSAVTVGLYLLYKDMEYMYRLRHRAQSLALGTAESSDQPHPITVKLTMMFATLQFVDMPLASWTLEWFPVQDLVGANFISVLGVVFSAVAFAMLISDRLKVRQLAFISFR